jgi:hypothetical protein
MEPFMELSRLREPRTGRTDRLSVDGGGSRSPSVQVARLEVVDRAIRGVGLRALEVENVAGDIVGARSGEDQ